MLVDQFIDRTFGRERASSAPAASPTWRSPIRSARAAPARGSRRRGAAETVARHSGGTYLVHGGPAVLDPRREQLYRSWGGDVIGMTNMPEAKLAREAEICLRDGGAWSPTTTAGTPSTPGRRRRRDPRAARQRAARPRLIERLAREFPRQHPACPIGSDRALDVAIITPPEARDPALLAKLDAVAGRLLGGKA